MDPRATIDEPGLLGAYTFAGAAPVINVDPSGLAFFSGHQRVAVAARARDKFDLEQFALKDSGEGDKAQKNAAARQKLLDAQSRAEAVLEPNALISIDLGEGTVKLGAPYGPRKKWTLSGGNPGSQAAPKDDAQDGADSKSSDSQDATSESGGPDSGDDALTRSASVSIDDADGEADKSGDDSAGDGDNGSAESGPPADLPPSPQLDQEGAAGADNNRLDD
jgi:hypothetical protein